MFGTTEQIWLTSVLTEKDVSKALVLCFSLRRAFTTRKIFVIVSSIISQDSRKALHHGFDLLLDMKEEKNVLNLEMEEFVKIYSLVALKPFKTCAYLSPSMIAMQNCDEIFSTEMSAFVFPEDRWNTSIFLFKPSVKHFYGIMEWLASSKTNVARKESHLRTWAELNFKMTGVIHEKYLKTNRNGMELFGSAQFCSLINLVDYPQDRDISNFEKTGILGKLVASHFRRIQMEDVLPLMSSLASPPSQSTQFISNYSKEPIAIVGMSCRYPGANTIDDFWELLFQNRDGTGSLPPFRWKSDQVARKLKNARKVNAGFLNFPVDEFDAKFFGIPSNEIIFMDPQHRLLHELAWEALEDACIEPHSLRGSNGSVVIGSWTKEYEDIVKAYGNEDFYRTYMGNSIGAAAARISFLLGLTGPSIATESGCSSAMVAVHLACRALCHGDTNLALACGVNLILSPFDENDMPFVVSPDGRCKTFSEDANGYGRAEGAGVLVLKRLSDALKDEDHIWGLIRGTSISQEGVSKSMGTPTVECESLAMKEALRDADLEPHEISYVEAHGTGTPVGDPLEVAAIAEAYSSQIRKEPLIIGSVKTNVGHTESCSGITGIMKVILAMKYEIIPAHQNFSKLNPSIDLAAVPAVIPEENMVWKKVIGKPRHAGVSSFGITGTDGHVIIEEPPQVVPPSTLSVELIGMQRPLRILKLSAKTEDAMNSLLEKYKTALEKSEDSIADICFSANTGRANFPIRAAILAKDKKSVVTAIDTHSFEKGEANLDTTGKICFLFSGQDSIHLGMGKSLYDSSPVFRMHIDHCDEILRKLYKISIIQILSSENIDFERDADMMKVLSVFCLEFALFKLWESWGVKPDHVLGQGVGEFAAAICAGILSVEDALSLIIEKRANDETIRKGDGASCNYISGMTGQLMERTNVDSNYWSQHSREVENILGASQAAVKLGCRTFIEIGGQPVISSVIMADQESTQHGILCLPSLERNGDDWTTILASVGKLYVKGVEINWTGFDAFYSRKKVPLPHYPFIGKKFWPDLSQQKEGSTGHPLIGFPIENATSTKLFQSELTLAGNEYLGDHKIAETIVFPGAGYLEMCLAAGLASIEGSSNVLRKPSRPMKIENLTITAPLAIEELKTCQLQTLVDMNCSKENEEDNLSVNIKIFHHTNSDTDSKWLKHAEASFHPLFTVEDGIAGFGKRQFHDILSKPSEDECTITQLYEKLSCSGLKFGPVFRSLKKVWKNLNGAMLAEMKVPSTGNKEEPSFRFILHPVILDAMFQAIMLPKLEQRTSKKIYVPVKVGKFEWISNATNESDQRYIYVHRMRDNYDENITALLLDSSGHILATMSDVEFVETTAKTLEAVLEQEKSRMPQMWEENWRPQVEPMCSTEDTDNFYNEIATKLGGDLHWLVFHHEDCPVSNFILEQLSLLTKRKVIVVRIGMEFRKDDTGFMVRADSEEDFLQLFNSILGENGGNSLEGVVYCWSIYSSQSTSQDTILQPFFYLSKRIIKYREGFTGLKLIVLIRGVAPYDDNDLSNLHSSTIWGFVKTFQLENNDINCRCVDIGTDESEAGMMQVFQELWTTGSEGQVAFHGTQRYVPKITSLKPVFNELKLPHGTDRFQLILPESKSIQDLEFAPLEPRSLEQGEIEIQVKSTALNFKDVLNIMKPSEDFKGANTVGLDFAGVVKRVHSGVSKWRVGDRVFGVNVNGLALPSHITLDENEVLSIPGSMTFSEASTLPAVGVTSYHCLIDIAKIQSQDTVLIHTASGGVGLCAIQICKHIGATVIATAGSNRKRNFLKSLGIQHVFNSRTLNYSDKILEVTNGGGVDVVLNSLTGEGFKESTLKACALKARFVEMSKLSIWKPEEVNSLRPDVQYSIVDLSLMGRSDWRQLLEGLWDFIEKGIVSPIPNVRFDAVNVREALQFMQKAKHIGKVVCTMPEVKIINGNREIYTPMFHDNSTYLITGGLGGIGFEVCKWMLKMGATHILLAGRSPPTPAVTNAVVGMNAEHSSKVRCVQLDVSDFEQCKHLISFMIPVLGFPALKGIMHAAGTIRDGVIENQTWASFSTTFQAKVTGTWNLHQLTRTIPTLEHFVLFSSVAARFGSPGQSNHSAGNQFEDTFAHYRHSVGLPATTINWCQWGEVGIATEFDAPGLKPISNLQGISALEYALKSHRIQTVVWNVESFAICRQFLPHISSYLDESTWKMAAPTINDSSLENYDEFWQQYDISLDHQEKLDMMKSKVRFILRNVLKLDPSEEMGDNDDLTEIGVDSLVHVEIRNALQTLVGDRAKVGTNILRDSSNITALSEALVRLVEGTDMEGHKTATAVEINQLIKEDCILPEQIFVGNDQESILLSDISVAMLTGVTGKMGPHVLKELTQNPQINRIFCLLRSKRNISPEMRLRNILEERQLFTDTDMSKVTCVLGDVASSQLGLETSVWQQLSDSVDAVFHFSALVRHTDLYSRDESGSGTRAVNVQGLKNILEFCCSGQKLKHVFNASTLFSVSALDEEENLSENWPDPNDFDGVTHMAYPISRFVGDMLMKEAITKRGIPGKVFRYPFISGDSETGRFVLEQNHLMLRYLFILKTGIMASTPWPIPVLPIDVAVKLSMEIFFNPDAANDIYNVINMRPDPDHEFVSIAGRLGYAIQIVSLSEFSKKVMESPEDSPLALFKDLYENEHVFMTVFDSVPALKQWMLDRATKEDFYMSKKIAKLIPDFYDEGHGWNSSMEYIYNDLVFAKKSGMLEKYGL